MRLLALTFLIFLASIDYLSKTLVKHYVENDFYRLNEFITIQIIYNRGIAFSIFDSSSSLVNNILSIVIAVIILFLLYVFIRGFNTFYKTELVGYMFLIGGALGNFLDRIINGSVLDFIVVNYNQIYFPAIFNIADIMISFGVLLIITNYLIRPASDKS
tara:strand:+ start:2737 stop:3213 length:477 start_codon:yes stop_codon:yes gene_type:complete